MSYKNLVIKPPKYTNNDGVKESQFYKGFSTVNDTASVSLFDYELIRQDLINRLSTARGERVMNPNFGTLNLEGEDADSWKANAITLSRTSTEKDPTIQALGIGGQVYGARANLIILDDCVTGANAHEWEKQLEWIQKEVVTRLDDEGILLIVGTRFAATDLYREIRSPKHWSNGKSPFTYFSMP